MPKATSLGGPQAYRESMDIRPIIHTSWQVNKKQASGLSFLPRQVAGSVSQWSVGQWSPVGDTPPTPGCPTMPIRHPQYQESLHFSRWEHPPAPPIFDCVLEMLLAAPGQLCRGARLGL